MKKILFITTILWLAVKMPAQDTLPLIVADTVSSDTITPGLPWPENVTARLDSLMNVWTTVC